MKCYICMKKRYDIDKNGICNLCFFTHSIHDKHMGQFKFPVFSSTKEYKQTKIKALNLTACTLVTFLIGVILAMAMIHVGL